MKIRDFFNKNKKFSEILLIFSEVSIDGLVLNFLAYAVFGLPFKWYTWIGYGFIPYVLGEIIPRILVKFKTRLE